MTSNRVYGVFARKDIPTGPLVRIEITEATFGKVRGVSRPLSIGETMDLERGEAFDLVDNDRARVLGLADRATGKLLKFDSSKFALPDEQLEMQTFDHLDEPFREWARREAEDAALRRRRDALRSHETKLEVTLAVKRGVTGPPGMRSALVRTREELEKVTREIAAVDHAKIDKLVIRANSQTLGKIAELNGRIDELEGVALRIFAARIAALDLHADKVAELARGSASYSRYVHPFGNLKMSGLGACWGYDDRGAQVQYLALEAPQMAGIYKIAVARLREVETAIVAAKGELKQVEKIFAATAGV